MSGQERGKPGYLDYLPGSYQILGPFQDNALQQTLVTNPGEAVDNDGFVQFWVRTPNVRCRTRIAIVLEPDDAAVDPNTEANTVILEVTGGTIWIVEKERTRAGKPQTSPVRNVIGTGATPLPIPTDARLWGFVVEVETNGRELYGQFTPPPVKTDPASSSKWSVLVTYESVERLSIEEWAQMKSQYGVRVAPQGGQVLLP